MAGQQSRRDKQRSAFGYVVRHLYFYGQKVWPGGISYECRGIQALYVVCKHIETHPKILKSENATNNWTACNFLVANLAF